MKDTNSIKRAIEEARQEHTDLLEDLKEYEKKKLRAEQLESFINMGVALLGEDKVTDEGPSISTQPLQPSQESTVEISHTPTRIQDGMIEILKGSARPLSLREIAEEFHKRNWKLSEKNSREVLRGVLKRNDGLFTIKTEGNKLLVRCK